MDNNTTSSTNDKELSRYEMLASFLTDDALNDVALKGTDGVTVPANRFLLAARSQVFRGMFVGKYQESSSSVVELGFEGAVLKAVVEYILTDSAEMLVTRKKRKSDDAPSIDYPQIQLLVSLVEASSYFNLPGLGKLVLGTLETIMTAWPSLSFAFLQACRTAGPSVPDDLVKQALASVRKTPTKNTSGEAVSCLSDVVLEEILKDTDTCMTEYQLFLVLSHWVEATGTSNNHQEDRQKTALGLSKLICLNKIDPDLLSTTVTSSGLFTYEELSEAYKCQALKAKQSHLDTFCSPRNATWTTEMNEKFAPVCIMVQGAGSDEVNGIYVRDGSHDGRPKYTMQGQSQGVPCVYWIFSSPLYWFISIPDQFQPGTDEDTDFYRARRNDEAHVPRNDNWELADEGVGPPPKLLYPYQGNQ